MSRCPNCSAELAHEYCPKCGQRRIDPQELSARHFLHELVQEIASLQAKFKTLRTLRALLTPGLLTAEYLAGRRQPHLSPFKVYFGVHCDFLSIGTGGRIPARIDACRRSIRNTQHPSSVLRVWKKDGGQWKIAAMFARPHYQEAAPPNTR